MEQDNSNKVNKELIEMAKEALKEAKPKYVDHKVETILKDMDIRPGPTKVPACVIYQMYHQIAKTPMKPMRFFKYMKYNFEYTTFRNEKHYYIDATNIDLTFPNIFLARQLMRKYYGKNKKKKNK